MASLPKNGLEMARKTGNKARKKPKMAKTENQTKKKEREEMNLLEAIMNSVAIGDDAAKKTNLVPPKNLPNERRDPLQLTTEDVARSLNLTGRRSAKEANRILPAFEGIESGRAANLFNDLTSNSKPVFAGEKAAKESQIEPLQRGSRRALEEALHAAIQSYMFSQSNPPYGDIFREIAAKPEFFADKSE